MLFFNKNRLLIFGYIIFVISCILWGMLLIVPWLGLSKGQLAGITTALIVAGEVTFYLSVFLLGKSFFNKIKIKIKFWKKKDSYSDLTSQKE